jgi:RNA polymerase sigma-70 factor (sigma-E family)
MKSSTHPGDALAHVFRSHQAELVRLAAFILGDRGAAEDVVQDVFIRVHQRAVAMTGEPLPYLRTAVVNGCRSVMRRRLLIRRHAEKDPPSPPLSAEEAVLLSEGRRQVLSALASLPRRRREVLVLRYYLGLSETEIAETLGISPGTVKSTAARGLAALAQALKETP